MNPNPITTRIGLANLTGKMPAEFEKREIPVLVSANALFDHARCTFREVPTNVYDLDVALDSAGFVAMRHYKRYPWTIRQYVETAVSFPWTWWAQMDACCEPEIAGDRSTVLERVNATARMLELCRDDRARLLDNYPEFEPIASEPMPVLQGWLPDDYRKSIDLADRVLKGKWPRMVGIGSVCRRSLSGPFGLWRILHAVDTALPPGVSVHLFGVKGTALKDIHRFPRVVSTDSMAFEFEARVRCREERMSKTISARLMCLDSWRERQQRLLRSANEPDLFTALGAVRNAAAF